MVASTDTDGENTSDSAIDGDATDDPRVLDAREIEGEPFGEIVDALEALPAEGNFRLVNSFEPVPLYEVLERRGFAYDTEQVDDEEWHVSITHA
jgi:uncharacterized protein (DUF2249 family)